LRIYMTHPHSALEAESTAPAFGLRLNLGLVLPLTKDGLRP